MKLLESSESGIRFRLSGVSKACLVCVSSVSSGLALDSFDWAVGNLCVR